MHVTSQIVNFAKAKIVLASERRLNEFISIDASKRFATMAGFVINSKNLILASIQIGRGEGKRCCHIVCYGEDTNFYKITKWVLSLLSRGDICGLFEKQNDKIRFERSNASPGAGRCIR